MIFNLPSCYFQSEDDEDSDGFDDEEDTDWDDEEDWVFGTRRRWASLKASWHIFLEVSWWRLPLPSARLVSTLLFDFNHIAHKFSKGCNS